MRRKRNMQAKVLKTDRQFQQQVVPSKKKRDKKLTTKQVEEEFDEELYGDCACMMGGECDCNKGILSK